MKKIFTLIAAALLAAGAQAQVEKYAIEDGFTPENNQKVQATSSITLEYGNDGKWKTAQSLEENDPKFSEEDGFPYYVVGEGNPKNSADKNFSPGNANTLPVKGTTYTFTANQGGTLEVAVKLNSGKSLYIADTSDGMNYSGDAVLTNTEGETIELSTSFQVSSSFTGFVKFDILKDQSLVVFCSGSKLSFFGFRFTPGDVQEDPGTPHAAQSWNFQSLLSETDKANIKADADWEVITTTNEETGEVKSINYKHNPKFEGTAATANGVELELTTGLRFITGSGKFEYYDGECLKFAGNGHGPVIPDCGKGDVVKIRFNAKAENGFEVGNLELTDGKIMADDEDTFEATLTVKKKGDVSFSSVKGANLLALSINKELPEPPSADAIQQVKAAQKSAAVYNLAGQKVGVDYKGIVIVDGKKMIK